MLRLADHSKSFCFHRMLSVGALILTSGQIHAGSDFDAVGVAVLRTKALQAEGAQAGRGVGTPIVVCPDDQSAILHLGTGLLVDLLLIIAPAYTGRSSSAGSSAAVGCGLVPIAPVILSSTARTIFAHPKLSTQLECGAWRAAQGRAALVTAG